MRARSRWRAPGSPAGRERRRVQPGRGTRPRPGRAPGPPRPREQAGTAPALRWRSRAGQSAGRSRRPSASGLKPGPERVHRRRADAVYLVELVQRRDTAVLIAELDDLLSGDRADAFDRVELVDGRRADADRP